VNPATTPNPPFADDPIPDPPPSSGGGNTDTDTGYKPPGSSAPTQAEKDAIALGVFFGNNATVSGSTVTLKADANIYAGETVAIPAGVTLDTAGKKLTVANGATLTVAEGGTIDLGAGTITIPEAEQDGTKGTVTNDGTIKTATTDKATLIALVGLDGEGKVVLNGASAITVTLTDPLELKTQDLVIGEYATLNLAANALTVNTEGTGSVTNNGTIKTAKTAKADLQPILNIGGNIDATATVVIGNDSLEVPAGTALTLSHTTASTIGGSGSLTVKDDGALTVSGALTNNGTIAFDANSGLVATGTITNNSTIETKSGTVLATLLNKVTAGTIEVTDGVTLAANADVTVASGVTLNVAASQSLTIPSGAKLTLNSAIGGTGTKTNNGTINTATDNATVLSAILNITGSGKVVLTGTGVSLTGKLTLGTDLVINAGVLTTSGTEPFDGGKTVTIGTAGKLDFGTAAITALGATITNNGNTADAVKTSTTSGAALKAILDDVTGNITLADDVTVVAGTTLKGGTTLTLASGTTLTVPEEVTLTIGNGGAATLVLTAADSQLVLQGGTTGGKVNAANEGSTIIKAGGSETGVTVSVYASSDTNFETKKGATSVYVSPLWTLTAAETSATIAVENITLGKFQFSIAASTAVNAVGANTGTAPGSLEAGNETAIVFAGTT
jgi:hypothetical protein